MVDLDPRSVAYTAAMVGVLLFLLATAFWLVRQTYRGFGQWVASLGLLALSLAGISWADLVPSWFAEMLINAASISSMLLAAWGAHRYLRRKPLDTWTVGFYVFGLMAVFVVQYTGPAVVRAGLGGIVMGALALRAAWLFVHPAVPGMRMAARLTSLLLITMAIERFWRASYFMSHVEGGMIMDAQMAALINHSFNAAFITLWAVAMLSVNVSRVEMELRRSRAELRELANKDPLTGLLNRRVFMDITRREVAKFRRYELPLSLIIIDLDHFKAVNDNFGHQTGDEVLTQTADILMSSTRETDVVARLGGEEFAILLIQTPMEQAVDTAHRIRKTIHKNLMIGEGKHHSVTASLGVGQLHTDDEPFERFFARVDSAMYDAKHAGRNQVITTE